MADTAVWQVPNADAPRHNAQARFWMCLFQIGWTIHVRGKISIVGVGWLSGMRSRRRDGSESQASDQAGQEHAPQATRLCRQCGGKKPNRNGRRN